MKICIITFVLLLGNLLGADARKGADELPFYRREFLSNLGLYKTYSAETGIWQFDLEKTATQKGVAAVYEKALQATDECTGAKYFCAGKGEGFTFIEKRYPLLQDVRELRLYFFFNKAGIFTKVGCSEAIRQ